MGTKQHSEQWLFFHRIFGKEDHLINWFSHIILIFTQCFVVTSNDPPSSRFESVFNLFLFRRELEEVVLGWVVGKKSVFLSRFRGFWNCDWGLTSLTNFYQRVYILLKKETCVRLPKENVFCPNNACETYIFNSWQHQKLLLVASQFQDYGKEYRSHWHQ